MWTSDLIRNAKANVIKRNVKGERKENSYDHWGKIELFLGIWSNIFSTNLESYELKVTGFVVRNLVKIN